MQELIIEKDNSLIKIIILEDNKIVELYSYDTQNMPKKGNIYIAKVKDINKNSGAIFIDYGAENSGYIDFVEEKYRVNDSILVMLKKEETLTKGAKFTTDISIAGKNIVLLPNSNVRTFSRKIIDESIKEKLIIEIDNLLPKENGFIIRSEANLNSIDEIVDELKQLLSKWNSISDEKREGLLYDANNVSELIIREFIKKGLEKIYINDIELYEDIKDFASCEIQFDNGVLFTERFGLITQIEDVQKRKIWLKSSGYISIDHAEALTAIDVNSGKYLGNNGFDKEDMSYKVNEEAAYEVMRQLRLKNIGGIIVVDFINMKKPENRDKILKIMEKEANRDRARIEVYGFTNLGLVEIARKKV